MHRPGKMNIADPLSRLSQAVAKATPFDEDAEHYVCQIVKAAGPVAIEMEEIENCSGEDDEIKAIKVALYENQWTKLAEGFKVFQAELCFADKILLRGNLIVMPKSLR